MTPQSDATVPVVPPMTGRYVIEKLLGRGGTGEVYLAHDLHANRPVALKLLPAHVADTPARRQRFLYEGRLAAALQHPHVCAVYNVGDEDGVPFIAMEYVDGTTLHECARAGRLSVDRILQIAIQLADALNEARRQQVVHRDLKSTNIVLTPDGDVKILDFGLAKRGGEATGEGGAEFQKLTDPGLLVGTPEYMSPEQVLSRPVDHRADLFSLGVVVYELLTGRLPFAGETTMKLFRSVLRDTPAPISDFNPDVPALVVAVVGKLLEKDRTQRYQSAEEVWTDLTRIRDRVPARRAAASLKQMWFRPLVGTAAGLVLSVCGVYPGAFVLCREAEAALLARADRGSGVWIGGASGDALGAVVPSTTNPSSVWIGNDSRVVYTTRRTDGASSLWTVGPGDHTPRLLRAAASDPAVTPDGRVVVFASGSEPVGLFRLQLDDSRIEQLFDRRVSKLGVTPDGRTVLFERVRTRTLWAVPLAGGPAREVSRRIVGSRPVISPDSHRVAFESDGQVLVCDLPDCINETWLRIGKPAAWTPDGRGLAYVGAPTGANIWVAPVVGGMPRQVTRFTDRVITSVAWSPDGQRLALTRVMTLIDLDLLRPFR